MKLQKINIYNFKGINQSKEISFDNFNVIVGQNDIGKSTILKALDCFLNGTSPTKEDLNTNADSPNITIILEFNPENQPIIIDENIETTFEEEELVNDNNKLIIKKNWDTSKSKISSETYILRKKYEDNDFLASTESQLITKCEQLGIDTQKANGEQFNNKEKRQKIREYNRVNSINFDYVFEKLPTSGSNRFKIIHDRIKKILPRFEYFKADTSLLETDTTIQKFFKTLAIKTIEEEIDITDIEDTIRTRLSNVLNTITDKINQVVPENEEVSAKVSFDWSKLVSTTFKAEKKMWIFL